jgi:hypothetical protein
VKRIVSWRRPRPELDFRAKGKNITVQTVNGIRATGMCSLNENALSDVNVTVAEVVAAMAQLLQELKARNLLELLALVRV